MRWWSTKLVALKGSSAGGEGEKSGEEEVVDVADVVDMELSAVDMLESRDIEVGVVKGVEADEEEPDGITWIKPS